MRKISIENRRASGVTTRKVDGYIQDLFDTRCVDLSNEEFIERREISGLMRRRLRVEHDIQDAQLIINDSCTLIELSKDYKFRSDYNA